MISRIICKIRSDTERTVYLAFTIIEKMQSLLKVKCITENNCFRPRINTQFFIPGNQAVNKFKFISRIASHSIEKLCLLPAKVRQNESEVYVSERAVPKSPSYTFTQFSKAI